MNLDILFGEEELQDPPIIECKSKDCSSCNKTIDEQFCCESKIKMNDYIRHLLGDVRYSSAIHLGELPILQRNFDILSENIKKYKEGKRNDG